MSLCVATSDFKRNGRGAGNRVMRAKQRENTLSGTPQETTAHEQGRSQSISSGEGEKMKGVSDEGGQQWRSAKTVCRSAKTVCRSESSKLTPFLWRYCTTFATVFSTALASFSVKNFWRRILSSNSPPFISSVTRKTCWPSSKTSWKYKRCDDSGPVNAAGNCIAVWWRLIWQSVTQSGGDDWSDKAQTSRSSTPQHQRPAGRVTTKEVSRKMVWSPRNNLFKTHVSAGCHSLFNVKNAPQNTVRLQGGSLLQVRCSQQLCIAAIVGDEHTTNISLAPKFTAFAIRSSVAEAERHSLAVLKCSFVLTFSYIARVVNKIENIPVRSARTPPCWCASRRGLALNAFRLRSAAAKILFVLRHDRYPEVLFNGFE